MAWRAARSLLTLHRQLKAASRAAPPATGADEWGLIGDALHDPTSDHAPHDFPGWGDDIVTAADFPNRPDLGLDAHQVLDDIRRSHDPRAKYGISNGQIFSNHDVWQDGVFYPAWSWRPYKGSDKHFTHGHLSVVGDARADGEQPWATIGGTMSRDYGNYGVPPAVGDRPDSVLLADVWAQELTGASPYDRKTPSARTLQLGRIEAKQDAILKALGVAQADLDELQARPAAELTEAQVAELGDRIAAAVVARPDNPLGDADKPAIVEAVKTALREGVGE